MAVSCPPSLLAAPSNWKVWAILPTISATPPPPPLSLMICSKKIDIFFYLMIYWYLFLLLNLTRCCFIYSCISLPGFPKNNYWAWASSQWAALTLDLVSHIIFLTVNVLCVSSQKAHLVTVTIPIERVILHHCSF